VAEAARLPRRVAVEGGATAAYRPLRPEELEHVRRKAGLESGHGVADTICATLSATTLAGVGVNALFGWWWADPTAGLVIAVFAAREGVEAWRD